MTETSQPERKSGGLARYFVEHPQVGWLVLAAVLVWGWFAYGKLAQQEDPKIPDRQAMLVTYFPGASTIKVEELVTKKIEKKISELETIDEISSQSRAGVSIIDVSLRFGTQMGVDQEWDKLRAKLREAELPEGCQAPWLNTDFGKTVTLLFALASPYFVKWLSSHSEYRYHVAFGKVILCTKKILDNEGGDVVHYVRNHQGGKWRQVTCEETPRFSEACIKEVSALGLQFGAVDFLNVKKQAVILEVNTAPGLEVDNRLDAYAAAFKQALEVT